MPLKEQSQASKTRPGYGETTSNIIESTWNMHYAARRANLARALLVMTRKHTDRIKSLKKEAAEWPVSAELTPRAEKKLEELRELCLGLSNIVVDNPATGRGSVMSPTDIAPIAVDASKGECAICQTGDACIHTVRIVLAAGAACQVKLTDLFPPWEHAAPWKDMYEKIPDSRPNFSNLHATRDSRALELKVGSGCRSKPGASKKLRIKHFLELRSFRRSSRAARAAADVVPSNAPRAPSPSKQPSPERHDGDAEDTARAVSSPGSSALAGTKLVAHTDLPYLQLVPSPALVCSFIYSAL